MVVEKCEDVEETEPMIIEKTVYLDVYLPIKCTRKNSGIEDEGVSRRLMLFNDLPMPRLDNSQLKHFHRRSK